MKRRSQTKNDYEPVTRSRAHREGRQARSRRSHVSETYGKRDDDNANRAINELTSTRDGATLSSAPPTFLKRGHAFSFVALFLFTLILYARPSEFYPSPLTNSIALIAGIATLALFIATQLALEGKPTASLREVNLLGWFALTALLSIPLAIDPQQAWSEFSGVFVRAVLIFIVIVNAVRTEIRLKALLFLAIATALWLSIGAINDYRLGQLTVEGYRVGGKGGALFGNSNDMALFIVTIIPIAIAMLLNSRGLIGKLTWGAAAVLMTGAVVVTYSRGGFVGLLIALGFLAWKTGDRHKGTILIIGFLIVVAFLLVAPGGYGLRLASIFIPSLDPVGSADARRGELFRSLYVTIRHPLFGIGMGNYASQMSYRGLVTHNSYTQVAAEMGVVALILYTTFIVSPLKKLGQIARETLERPNGDFHYLALGIQASLLGYLACSFFASVAYLWYIYYLVGYAVCLRRLYEAKTGRAVLIVKEKRRNREVGFAQTLDKHRDTVTV